LSSFNCHRNNLGVSDGTRTELNSRALTSCLLQHRGSHNRFSDGRSHSSPREVEKGSLSQKIIALGGVFVLGATTILTERQHPEPSRVSPRPQPLDFWEKPLTNIGFVTLPLGVVLGLAQYWISLVFAGFILLLAGIMLYPIGRLTEKTLDCP
jgi:hypothetical protein